MTTQTEALKRLTDWAESQNRGCTFSGDHPIAVARAVLAAPAYADSTPHFHVGDTAFEDWFQRQPFATQGVKQIARDAYAAGMGDPLVAAAPTQEAEAEIEELLWPPRAISRRGSV